MISKCVEHSLLGGDGVLLPLWEKDHRHGVLTRAQIRSALVGQNRGKEFVRDLCQDARAIASALISADATTVREIHQSTECALNNFTGRRARDVDDETDTTGVVFEGGIVQRS